ncbi:MAG: L-aspartate oxidase [Oscillospiraceae bacterium]
MQKKYDVVIVGSGVAGLYAALQFNSKVNVLVLTKKQKAVSNSSLAQGGVAAVLDFDNDSFDLHIYDTMIAGGHKNNLQAVQTLISEGPNDVREIMEMGFDYDKNEDGTPKKTLEGGHSRRRIVHHKDTTGDNIVTTLLAQVETHKNIEIAEYSMVSSMNREKIGFRLDLIVNKTEHTSVFTDYCLIATGGIGRVYKYTTNPIVATGDGIRMASEIGADIKNLSFVQFHPTAFNAPNSNEQFLISEAVRGEGAYLLNCNKERFMQNYDKRLELAPRDVVSSSIITESKRTNSNCFYLDIRFKGEEFIKNRFPGISKGCLEHGVDITKELIPIFPCQHYLMGGIDTNLNGETTVSGLFAAGECAHTGVHGGNRLASNSLLEALVFGRRAATEIQKRIKSNKGTVEPYEYHITNGTKPIAEGIVEEIRSIMQDAYFVMPDDDKIKSGCERVNEIRLDLKEGDYDITMEYCEALSLATVATIILTEVYEKEKAIGKG